MRRPNRFAFWLCTVLLSSSTFHAATAVTILDDTLAPLVEQFNRDAGKPRVLTLLSPT